MNSKSLRTALKRISFLKWPLIILLALSAWFGIHCALILRDGVADSFSSADPADAAVILGNLTYSDGRPGDLLESRLQKGMKVFTCGAARNLICSGGKGPAHVWEAEVMREWLLDRGVDPARIIVDNEGKDSYSTARSARAIFDSHGWKSALIVSNITHISRCKLAFRRFGFSDLRSAHAETTASDGGNYVHEFLGYYYYLLRMDK